MIEDLLWSKVFSSDVVAFCKVFFVLIIFLRLSCFLIGNKVSKAFAYVPKIMAYGFLIYMMWLYFSNDENNVHSINVFTGFTLVFCVVEAVDNSCAFLLELFGEGIVAKIVEKKLTYGRKEEFQNVISELNDLYFSLKPGKISDECKRTFGFLWDEYRKSSFYYAEVEAFLDDGGDRMSTCLCTFFFNPACQAIHRKVEDERSGKITKKLILSSDECNEMKIQIKKIIDRTAQYDDNFRKALIAKKKMSYLP